MKKAISVIQMLLGVFFLMHGVSDIQIGAGLILLTMGAWNATTAFGK